MSRASSSSSSSSAESVRRTISTLTELFPILDPEILQGTVDEVLTTLNEPEFREEVKKTVELSYSTSLQIMQRFVRLSREMQTSDRETLAAGLRESVPKLVKTNLSMMIELLTLNQKYSSMLLDILEKSGKKREGKEEEETTRGGKEAKPARASGGGGGRNVRPRRR